MADARREFLDAGKDFVPDADIPFGVDGARMSDRIESLPESEARALDSMIEKHGLSRVLKTVRELCDARTPSIYESDMTFEKLDREQAWGEYADALETAIARIEK